MKPTTPNGLALSEPVYIANAQEIAKYLGTLRTNEIQKTMGVSKNLAIEVEEIISQWSTVSKGAAMFSFRGDVYSGLQVDSFSNQDIAYANDHLRIISGLYGILRPLDAISPYRLEMAYKLPNAKFKNLYKYWGTNLADTISNESIIINLTSEEYSKAIIPYIEKAEVITPRFYTLSPKTNKYTTVAVHSKIARGAFSHWLIKHRVKETKKLKDFNALGYKYDATISKESQPGFVCKEFGGKGLSVRLK